MTLSSADIVNSLEDHVSDQLNAVTFKWVARHFNIPYDTSKRILFEFLSKKGPVSLLPFQILLPSLN